MEEEWKDKRIATLEEMYKLLERKMEVKVLIIEDQDKQIMKLKDERQKAFVATDALEKALGLMCVPEHQQDSSWLKDENELMATLKMLKVQ